MPPPRKPCSKQRARARPRAPRKPPGTTGAKGGCTRTSRGSSLAPNARVTTALRSSPRAFFVRRVTTQQVSVDPVGEVSERELARFRLALGELRTLGAVLDWLRVQEPPRAVHEIV